MSNFVLKINFHLCFIITTLIQDTLSGWILSKEMDLNHSINQPKPTFDGKLILSSHQTLYTSPFASLDDKNESFLITSMKKLNSLIVPQANNLFILIKTK
jgi:hypothetical protein